MKQMDLNKIPLMLEAKEISEQKAINILAVFVQNNSQVFGILNTQEDLKSEIILKILEKGHIVIKRYNSEYGSFFNYFFCFIKSSINTYNKKNVTHSFYEYHNISESILSYQQEEEAYAQIKSVVFNSPKIPFNYKKINPEIFQIACKDEKYTIKKYLNNHKNENSALYKNLKKISPLQIKKILLVLTLKSSYYITDEEIITVSEICNIKYEILLNAILQLKEELISREKHKKELEIRRNKAYYHHKKYKNLINYINSSNDDNLKFKINSYNFKYKRHTKCWQELNNKLKKGIINIRPTNKAVADILGICERQVSYYIKNVEKLKLNE